MADALTNIYVKFMNGDYAIGTSIVISSVFSTVYMAAISTSGHIHAVLLSKVRVSSMDGTLGTKQGREVDEPTLAKQWNIPHDRAANMVRMTTQQGVCAIINPMKRSCYPSNSHMLGYK